MISSVSLSNRSSVHLSAMFRGKRGLSAAFQDRLLEFFMKAACENEHSIRRFVKFDLQIFDIYFCFHRQIRQSFCIDKKNEKFNNLNYNSNFEIYQNTIISNVLKLLGVWLFFFSNKSVYNKVSPTKYMPIFVKCI